MNINIEELAKYFHRARYTLYLTCSIGKYLDFYFVDTHTIRYNNENPNEIRFLIRCKYWKYRGKIYVRANEIKEFCVDIEDIISIYQIIEPLATGSYEVLYECIYYESLIDGIKLKKTLLMDENSAKILISLIKIIATSKTQMLIDAINAKDINYYKNSMTNYAKKLEKLVELIDERQNASNELRKMIRNLYSSLGNIKCDLESLKEHLSDI